MEKELYRWQKECLKRWRTAGGRGMVQAATGSGKTHLALTAASCLEKEPGSGLKVKIVVPTGALMRQWNQALREFFSGSDARRASGQEQKPDIGLKGGGQKSSPDHKYMIYVINSARYELARQILAELKRGERILLIADECHRYESGQNRLIFEFMPYIESYSENFFSLGLSATLPSGEAGRFLSSVLGPRVYSYGIGKASAQQTVSKYDIYHIGLSFQEEERNEYEELSNRMTILYRRLLTGFSCLSGLNQKDLFEMLRSLAGGRDRRMAETASLYMRLSYQRKRLVCQAGVRIQCVCELIKRLPAGEKIIIFGESISQAQELYGLLDRQYEGRTGRYHSRMGHQANRNTLERFRSGDIRILIACKALDEGLDVPDASVGIILSCASTQRQRIQRLGRIIRKKEEKDRASLYYLHVTETSEDSCYLPDGGENRILELEYLPDTGEFYNESYERAAVRLLKEMEASGADRDKVREAQRCLQLGSVRADWMTEPDDIEEKIKSLGYVKDRNYWVCMKRLRRLAADEASRTERNK